MWSSSTHGYYRAMAAKIERRPLTCRGGGAISASEHRQRRMTRRPTIAAVLVCVAFAAAGTARAAASTLNLSVSPYTDSSANSAATITASGNTGADPYGLGWELDVFTGSAGSTCAATAESEDQNLGFPSFDTAPYPGFAHVTGPFSQNFTLDSGTSTGGTYAVCAYLS